jgi:formylglycine-generating enzyme required for sulfatase activity
MTGASRYFVGHTLPLERLSPDDFERLCLWLVKREHFGDVEHVGGSTDEGCDLSATLNGATYVFQCKRTRRFAYRDAEREIKKIRARSLERSPDCVVFVTPARVSALTRRKCRVLWGDTGACLFWSDTELDEMVKRHHEILDEFFMPAIAPAIEHSSAVLSNASYATNYLMKAKRENSFLDVRGLGPHGLSNIELTRVYTRLRVIPGRSRLHGSRGDRSAEYRPEADVDSMATEDATETVQLKDLMLQHRNLVIEGGPGSGKTTFLRFICLNLSRALLDEDRAESLERIGIRDGPPFPVLVRLSQFASFLEKHPRTDIPEDAAEHFLQFLDFSTTGHAPDLSPSFLRSRVLSGKCLILLDGLDEVPGNPQRRRVSRIIDQLAILGDGRHNRHVVTSRTIAYMGKAQLTGEFTRAALVEFDSNDIELFVHNWTTGIMASNEPSAPSNVLEREQDLLAAINKSATIRALAGNPLMLSVISIVHFNSVNELPSQRTELFARIISHLLESRQEISGLSVEMRAECMLKLAISMYKSSTRVLRAVELRAAARLVSATSGRDLKRAAEYLEAEALHSGILVSRTQGELEFWHLNFQEYLAAKFLSGQSDYLSFLDGSIFEDRWREVIQHLAGCLLAGGTSGVAQLVAHVLGSANDERERLESVGLVGLILRNLGSYPDTIIEDTGYVQATREAFAVASSSTLKGTLRSRIDVFDALAIVGDHRLSDWGSCWTCVDPGVFLMGAQRKDVTLPGYDPDAHRDESPVTMISLDGFKISKYLVTVSQFKAFVDDCVRGYSSAKHWSPSGDLWRRANRIATPGRWAEQLNYVSRPVVNITWYEAEAYCSWLAELLGARVRLPSEAEWEFVARGTEGRKFATQINEMNADYANYDGFVGVATPVGLYASNSAQYEVYDLVGNAWEWCQDSWFSSYEGRPSEGTARENSAPGDRVRRGGSWKDSAVRCRAAFRSRRPPGYSNDLIGFRPVMELNPGGPALQRRSGWAASGKE